MPSALPVAPLYPHVNFDVNGVPILAGTTMKVVELVMAQEELTAGARKRSTSSTPTSR